MFLFKQEIFRFQPFIFEGCIELHEFPPPKNKASVGGRALDQVIIDQKMQKQLCQVENSDFLLQKTPKTGGKLTMNYLPVLEGSKKANIY